MKGLNYNYVICTPGGFYDISFADVVNLANVRYFSSHYSGLHSWFQRALFRINFSKQINHWIKEPFSFYVNSRLYRNDLFDKQNTIVVFCANVGYVYNTSYIHYLKQRNPHLKFVLYFTDLVSKTENVDLDYIRNTFDVIISYDRGDANKYDFKYYPTPYSRIYNESLDVDTEEYDLYFCGKAKDRYQTIFHIYEQCVSKGLKCDFYLYNLSEDKRIYGEGLHYDIPMSYVENIRQLQKSRAILEIMQRNADGFTPRLWEAIMYDKHLLTNNEAVFNSVYCDNVGVHSIDILERKDGYFEIKNNVKYSDNLKKSISPIAFLEYIESLFTYKLGL